jgi:hypothetical protein
MYAEASSPVSNIRDHSIGLERLGGWGEKI